MIGESMIKKFNEWLNLQGWNVIVNTERNLNLNDEFIKRYSYINNEYEEFLKYFKEEHEKRTSTGEECPF